MFSRRISDMEIERSQSNILNIAEGAICLAVKTALGLVDVPDSQQSTEKVLARAVSKVLCLGDKMEEVQLPEVTLDQVSWHDSANDCWTVIYDYVYDITEFLWEHPGGGEILLEYAGRDASLAFRGVGHTQSALRALDKYVVGILPEHERIFKNRDGPLCKSNVNIAAVTVGTG